MCQASLLAQSVKYLPAVQETWVRSLGQEDPLEEERATHSSILAWKFPWAEEPGRLQPWGTVSSSVSQGDKTQTFLSSFQLWPSYITQQSSLLTYRITSVCKVTGSHDRLMYCQCRGLEKAKAPNSTAPACLENAMDGGAWWAAVHGVAKSRT